jgi:hypothetical protein
MRKKLPSLKVLHYRSLAAYSPTQHFTGIGVSKAALLLAPSIAKLAKSFKSLR